MGIDDLTTEHMANWFECMRSRQQPHATVHSGICAIGRVHHGGSIVLVRQESLLGREERNDLGKHAESQLICGSGRDVAELRLCDYVNPQAWAFPRHWPTTRA